MYDNSLKHQWDNQNILDYAVATAEARGMEKGEYNKALAIAKKMKASDMPVALIANITGLSLPEIEEL